MLVGREKGEPSLQRQKRRARRRRVVVNTVGSLAVMLSLMGAPKPAESTGRYAPIVSQEDIAACGQLANIHIDTIEQAGGHNFIGAPTEACPVWVAQFRLTGSPSTPYAVAMYQYLIDQGVNPGAINAWLRRESNLGNDGGADVKDQNICNIMYNGSVKDFSQQGGWMTSFQSCVAMVEYWSTRGNVPGVDGQPDSQVDHILSIISPQYNEKGEVVNDTPEMINTIKYVMDRVNRESFPYSYTDDLQVRIALLPSRQRTIVEATTRPHKRRAA